MSTALFCGDVGAPTVRAAAAAAATIAAAAAVFAQFALRRRSIEDARGDATQQQRGRKRAAKKILTEVEVVPRGKDRPRKR